MTLRRRLTIAGTLAVALAVTVAVVAAYVVVRAELLGRIDDGLRGQSRAIATFTRTAPLTRPLPAAIRRTEVPQPRPSEGGPLPYVQVLDGRGRPRADARVPGSFAIGVDGVDRLIAVGDRGPTLRTVRDDDGARLRLITVPVPGGAVQLARPLGATEDVLARLRLLFAGLVLAGIATAVVLGRLVTRRVTAPLREVVAAADHIATTDDLRGRLTVRSRDEVGELAERFNSMLDRLSASREELASSVASQRQLVADASHELRTPITSLRTNVEVLLDDEAALDPSARERLLADVRAQTEELGEVVTDIIDLARGDVTSGAFEDVRLDEIVRAAVDRARRDHPAVTFSVRAAPATLDGDPVRLARAIGNLLGNAAVHGGRAVVVEAGTDGVVVTDDGPGFADGEAIDRLFDRFARGRGARATTGTGLGLAIVRQVAESHGGSVHAENVPAGGARLTLRLPARPVDPDGAP